MIDIYQMLHAFFLKKYKIKFNKKNSVITIDASKKSVHSEILSYLESKGIDLQDYVYYYSKNEFILQKHPQLF